MSKRILWAAAALAALVACEKSYEEPAASVVPEAEPENATPWILKNMFDEAEPANGAPFTFRADFGGTRAHIEMNEAGTYAQSVWKAGDAARIFAIDLSSGGYQYAEMTAATGGASVEFNTPSGLTMGSPFYVTFPASSKVAKSNGRPLFGVNIPAEQEAVAGGIKDGYTVAYVTVQSTDEFLHFKNKVSLVRFRMSGAIASQVKSVTIKGISPLAGDAVLLVDSEGEASYTDRVSFGSDVKSLTVTLSGDFVAGQDYYLVLKPGTQSSFKMIFADGEGQSTTKISTGFTFPEGRISDFGTIDLGDAFTDDNVSYEPIPDMTATAGAAKPVTSAVIGDGFTKDQMSDFEMLAKAGIDALMNTEPYKSYSDYFNVWILKAASKESGASITDGNGNVTTFVDTYFGSKWGESSYSDMAANATEVYNFVSENCPDIKNGIHPIQEVPVLLIVNDERYGGICHSSSNGQGYGMVPWTGHGRALSWSFPSNMASTDNPLPTPVTNEVLQANYRKTTAEEMAAIKTNSGDWRNTLVHEFGGHCFGRLSDEYWSATQLNYLSGPIDTQTWPVPFGKNLAHDPTAAPWKSDLLDYPLATLVEKDANYGRIGAFQGGGTYMYGRWRSEMISCMIDNRFYFSTWQRMLIVQRIMTLSGSTFDVESFWANDVTTDPVRDTNVSSVMGDMSLPVQIMPPLPEPVLTVVD